jgi:hypothetical protein
VRVDAFLKKPFRMDDFTGVVQSVLDRRSVSGIDFKSKEHPGVRISERNRAQGGR